MRKNSVRQRLRSGKPALGALLGLGSPHVAELMAHAGYDWLVLETEHNALDAAQVERMLMAISGTDVIPLVRPPSGDPLVIQKALDIGAMGVFVPMVRSAAEAEAIVRATRYPPEGRRGFGPLRASRYTLDYADYLASANENILVALILETKEAVDDIEAIMDVPGIDALYFGLFDLCLSLGLNPMEMPFPEIDDIMERTLALGKERGVAVGVGATTPDELRQRLSQGYTFMNYGTDYQLLRDAVLAGIDAFRAAPSEE
jgi:2-keto-3-deoxy-L-rhamnonate aldolase RhmA